MVSRETQGPSSMRIVASSAGMAGDSTTLGAEATMYVIVSVYKAFFKRSANIMQNT
jgi:hypothetical protein